MARLGTLTKTSSYDDVAEAIVAETIRRGYTRDQAVPVLATAIQESGLRPDAVSPNGKWVGIFQQDTSYPRRGDPNFNIEGFLDRLGVKLSGPGASSDMWRNIFWLQQRPGEVSADQAYANGRKAYLTEIQTRTAEAARLYDRYAGGAVPTVADNRPSYNEYANWTKNNNSRGGTKVDLWLIHSQEGGGGDNAADDLSRYIRSTENMASDKKVSYHYVLSQASDGGVTVVDCVDTDFAAWSVGDANARSINLCFAGSRAAWTREQWLKQAKAIDVAAYLAVQDCKKYSIPTTVIGTGGKYSSARAGLADHRYVTDVIGWGTHTDVGPGFPVDVFTTAVNKYATGLKPEVPVVVKRLPQDLTDRKVMEDVWVQLLGPDGRGWPQLGQNEHGQNLTLVDAVAELRKASK